MLGNIDLVDILLWFVVFLFSLSFHEAAHAWTSDRFGDDTGRLLGRVSLNPAVHIDPIGTVLFPLMSSFTGIPLFGWAKPVPVNPLNWREKDKANILVSAAGPISNLILALIFFVLLKLLLTTGTSGLNYNPSSLYDIFIGPGIWEPITKVLTIGVFLNVTLAVFNLFPVPPLDGSHVMESLLPYEAARAYEQLAPYGWILLIGLMLLGVFSAVLVPIQRFVLNLLV